MNTKMDRMQSAERQMTEARTWIHWHLHRAAGLALAGLEIGAGAFAFEMSAVEKWRTVYADARMAFMEAQAQ